MSELTLSIIMPVYNSAKYLREAIESVLNQDFIDFELIIIDDGSTDDSTGIIKSFKDGRIRFLQNHRNRGIVYSRNFGITNSKGTYIGMLDSDDIALPNKFKRQIEFLEKHKSFGMVGSWAMLIDENGKQLDKNWKLTANAYKIPSIMLFRNYFVQSSVVFRRDLLPCYLYKEGYEIVEDYKLWLDIMKKAKAWNLQEYLVKYRIHSNNITQMKKAIVDSNLKAVYQELLNELSINPSEEQLKTHFIIKNGDIIRDFETYGASKHWLELLIKQNKKTRTYCRKAFSEIVLNRWLKVCYMTRKFNMRILFGFIFSPILFEYLKTRLSLANE